MLDKIFLHHISITDSNLGESNEQIVVNGIEQLEYKIIDGLFRLNNNKKSKLAFITSHETSPNIKISDWISELQTYYEVIAFDLKKYKPDLILIEFIDPNIKEYYHHNINNVLNSNIYKFMDENDYKIINWVHDDLVFVPKNINKL